jgi:3-isopropylmalate/(R)-2-methylmalate dehydratase large subunit
VQHGRGTRRAGGADRARRDDGGVPRRARRDRDRHRALAGRCRRSLRTETFDAAALKPQVAAPHSPANAGPADGQRGVAIQQAYIGACTGAKINDLRMAAEILRGRKVAPGVRLLVAPATARTTAEAAADGTLASLAEAGAILLPSGCGACAGYGAGVLAEGEVCIASTARNFKGRMGASSAKVYLGSPYTVAAAAVAGMIVDPREVTA